jgi:hypothetical protein
MIEFRGYPLLVGLRRKGKGGEAMGEKQTSGDRASVEVSDFSTSLEDSQY